MKGWGLGEEEGLVVGDIAGEEDGDMVLASARSEVISSGADVELWEEVLGELDKIGDCSDKLLGSGTVLGEPLEAASVGAEDIGVADVDGSGLTWWMGVGDMRGTVKNEVVEDFFGTT